MDIEKVKENFSALLDKLNEQFSEKPTFENLKTEIDNLEKDEISNYLTFVLLKIGDNYE